MRLLATVLPPQVVLDEVADVVRSVAPGTHELEAVPAELMHLPITNFGNVTLADARQLLSAIARDAAHWRAPELRFEGGTALEFQGDLSVWAKVTGDIDDLNAIGRGVPVVVQRLGFFVDRRKFRPWLSVGTITDTTTAPYLERLVGALDGFRGTPFVLDHLTILRRLPVTEDGSDGGFEIYDRVPLKAG